MEASSADLDIPKYTGSADDGPVEDWFDLYEFHATAESWSEREMVANFNDYVIGEAFRFYLTHIFQNSETWKRIKEEMIARFKDYGVDSPISHQFDTFRVSRGSHKQLSYSHYNCRTRPDVIESSTNVPNSQFSQYTTRTQTPGLNLQLSRDNVKPVIPEQQSTRNFKRVKPVLPQLPSSRVSQRPNLPPAFPTFPPAEKSLSPTSSLRCSVVDISESSHALDSTSHVRGAPPGFPTNGSNVVRKPPCMLRKVTTFTVDELMHQENNAPSFGPSTEVHAIQESSAMVPEKYVRSQALPGHAVSAALPFTTKPPQCREHVDSAFKKAMSTFGDKEKTCILPVHYPETSTLNEELSNNSGPPMPLKRHCRQPCATDLLPRKWVRKIHRLQRRPGQGQRRTKPKTRLVVKKGRFKASVIKQRQARHLRHPHRKKPSAKRPQRHLQHQPSGVHLQPKRLPKLGIRRKYLQETTPCIPLEHGRHLVRLMARTSELENRCIYWPRPTVPRLRHPNYGCCNMHMSHAVVTWSQTASTSVSTLRACLRCPDWNSQPRPPE